MNYIKEMTVGDWIKIEDNPIQRDTERHAMKAKHLMVPLPVHAITFAAQLPNGRLIKLDGHTRALLWKRNTVKHPPKVIVNILPAKDMEEVKRLYTTLDSKEALETSSDKVTGGYHQVDFSPQSALLRTGAITNGLRVAMRGLSGMEYEKIAKLSVYEIISEYVPELVQLDQLITGDENISEGKAKAPGAIVAAFLLTNRKWGDKVIPFWRAYFGQAGIRAGAKMDGVQALHELVISRKRNNGGSAVYDLCSRAIRCVEKWLADEMLNDIPRPMDISDYADSKPASHKLIKSPKKERERLAMAD